MLSFPLRIIPFPLGAPWEDRKGDVDETSNLGVQVDDQNKVELRQVLRKAFRLRLNSPTSCTGDF